MSAASHPAHVEHLASPSASGSPDETRRALVVGASGIVGQAACRRLLAEDWDVVGLTRSGTSPQPEVRPVAADLTVREALAEALAGVDPDLVVITAWTRMQTEAENIAVNGGAVRDLLGVLGPSGSMRHVALMTGLKHYLGPFEAYGKGDMPDTPFREEAGRLPYPNFYYAQEDELFSAAAQHGFTWSVHRAHTVFGHATGNAMNMVATLCAYASLCRHLGRPFVFPGSETQWNALTDVTDADIVAEQMIWAADAPAGHDQAFNIANGDVFRWRWLWPQVADFFELPWEGFSGAPRPLEEAMAGTEGAWAELARKHGLAEPDLTRVASWWHSDADLGRDMEVATDMNKSRAAGFTATRDTRESFFGYARRYREGRVIP